MPTIVAERKVLTQTGATSATIGLPAHSSGDLLVVTASQNYGSGGNITCATSGWSVIAAHKYGTGIYDTKIAFLAKKATSSAETSPVLSSTDAQPWATMAWVVKGWNDTGTIGDAFANITTGTVNAANSADGRSATMRVTGVTTATDNCLVMAMLSFQSTNTLGTDPIDRTQFLGSMESASHQLVVGYKYQATAGATGDFDFNSDYTFTYQMTSIVVAIKDGAAGYHMPYFTAQPITVLDPWYGTNTTMGNTIAGSLSIATLLGRTANKVAGSTLANGGCSLTDSALDLPVAAANSQIYGYQRDLNLSRDMSTGFFLGTYRFISPASAEYIGLNNTSETGICVTLLDASNNYSTWGVAGLGDKDLSADGRNIYVIQTNQSTDTRIASSGTLSKSAVKKVMASMRGVYGVSRAAFSQMIHVPAAGFSISGGGTASPINGERLERFIGKGYALACIKDGVSYVPLLFTGNFNVDFDLYNLRFPTRYSTGYSAAHVDDGALGLTINASASAVVKMTNGQFSSGSKWHFVIHASSSASASYNFSGRTLVNAVVTLRPVCTFSGMGFVNCTDIAQNDATITGCTFSASSITADNIADISSSSFKSGGTGHAITITAAGTYTISGLTFTGYGADDTTDAAIYNNSGGVVTLSVSGGGSTPTIRNGAGASTTVESGAGITVEGLVTGSRVVAKKVSDNTVLFNGSESTGSITFFTTYIGAIKLEARKASASPFYKPWVTLITPVSGQTSVVTALQELDE
jgi:hypothetical protein